MQRPYHPNQRKYQDHSEQNHAYKQHDNHNAATNANQWLAVDTNMDVLPEVLQRRAKRQIPDTEKDDGYWERRKRNNMAAKRSRENKRLLDNDMKYKVSYLEEQNALLLLEISLIKRRFGIPTEQSILTSEERAQCILEVNHLRVTKAARHRNDSSNNNVSSTSQTFYTSDSQQGMGETKVGRRDRLDSSDSSTTDIDESYISGSPGMSIAHTPFTLSAGWCPSAFPVAPSFTENKCLSPFSRNQTSNSYIDHTSNSYNPCVKSRKDINAEPVFSCISENSNSTGRGLLYISNDNRKVTSIEWCINRNQRHEPRLTRESIDGGFHSLMNHNHIRSHNYTSRDVSNITNSVMYSAEGTPPCIDKHSFSQQRDCNNRLVFPTRTATFSKSAHHVPGSNTHSNIHCDQIQRPTVTHTVTRLKHPQQHTL